MTYQRGALQIHSRNNAAHTTRQFPVVHVSGLHVDIVAVVNSDKGCAAHMPGHHVHTAV